ncbi:MAG TPA: LysR family transcriptional regulator [Actinocrinis sp.]|nr:LysR family transcriptional regulator [Actinocrinis sp.]
MNLVHLECFLAVAEELHFGRAAERLHRSPATVSESVSALEGTVGCQLFHRTSRRVQLTPDGRLFLQEVKGPYEQLVRAHARALTRGRRQRELRIAHTPELGHLLLPALHAAVPRDGDAAVRWRPVLMHTQEQQRAVAAGSVDIGLCWAVRSAPPLRSVVLRELPMVIVLCDDDPLAGYSAVRLEQLIGREVLMTPRRDNAFLSGQIQLAFAQAGLNHTDVQEVPRYEELVMQVAAGRLVGLHASTISAANRVPGMAFRPVEPELTVTICALLREDRADAVIDGLLGALRTAAAGFGGTES